jgi:hypothetical protein
MAAGFLLLTWHSISLGPYIYDEADYLTAASRGVAANAFETGSVPVAKLVKIAVKRRRESGSLSTWVRNSNDVSFYRHWHGPLFFYYLMLVDKVSGSEFGHRAAMMLFPLLTLGVVWFGGLRIFPERMKYGGAAITTALVIWNFAATRSSEIAPHQLYAFTAVTSLMLLSLAILKEDRRSWYLSVAFAALAFLTLEIAFTLAITLLIVAWIERRALGMNRAMLAKSVALFLGIVFVLWPASVLRFSFLKAYFSLAYISVLRKPWGDTTLADSWLMRLGHSPVQWGLTALAIILFFARPKLPVRRLALPFLLGGGVTLAVMARVANDTSRYDLPYAQAFAFFTGLVLTAVLYDFKPLARYGALAGIAAGCLATTWLAMQSTREIEPSPVTQVLEAVRQDGLCSARILAPQDLVPVLHYYFPETRLRAYREDEPTPEDLGAAVYDAVIQPGDQVVKLR